MSKPITVWIRGYKYVDIQQAADLLHYSYQSVQYWMRQAQVRTTKYENRTLVCLSDCYALEKEKKATKPTQERLKIWAAANPQKLKQIRDYKQLLAALRRDNVQCSRTHASSFLARVRGAGNWAVLPKVVRWIEDDPTRIYLEFKDFARTYHAATGTLLDKYKVKKAKTRDRKRHPDPPFDLSAWCDVREVAQLLQISRAGVTSLMHSGRLGEVKRHKEAHYVRRDIVDARARARQRQTVED